MIKAYDFDGIDIDWEYPGYAPHSGRDVDTINYNLFLQAIRDALDEYGRQTGRFYGLTAALPCGPTIIDNIQINEVKDILTEFNLMTYDFHGSWNAKTGVNAPLYDQDGAESEHFSLHACAQTWMEGGARPEQVNIGLPFYGRSFAGKGITGLNQPHEGVGDLTAWSADEGSPQYFNIVDKISGFTSFRDEQTKTQLAYNSAGFLSYDDERAICDKCEYGVDHALNGYIIWEISGDLMEDLSQPLLDACNNRINDLTKRCDGSDTLRDWYAHSGIQGVCVRDGNHEANFIPDESMYTSAKECCDANYDFVDTCLSASLDPGSDGKWHESMEGNPFYPHKGGYCVDDGDHDKSFIDIDQMFVSAEACCDSVYSYDPDCLKNSLAEAPSTHVAPTHVTPSYSTTPRPTTPKPTTSKPTTPKPTTPKPTTSKPTTSSPTTEMPSFLPTDTPVKAPKEKPDKPPKDEPPIDDFSQTEGLFYPHYGNGQSASAECRNDGNAPSWITADMMMVDKSECCTTYFFPSWSETCISDDDQHPYYPDFKDKSCRNDGGQPSWMVGDYLADRHVLCCDTHFGHDEDLLSGCKI